jgi:hypothetical protein
VQGSADTFASVMNHTPPRRPGARLIGAIAARSRRPRRGQSLVELAIILPVLLLLTAGAIDLGRAFFGAINLENAVKEGAFFGARQPECSTDAVTDCDDPSNVEARVETELHGIDPSSFQAKCFDPGTTNFSGAGKALADCEDGDVYYVRAQIPFTLVTPIISNLIGSSITLTSDASAVVLTSFEQLGGEVAFPSGSESATPVIAMCTVPDFSLGPTKIRDAEDVWADNAGFERSNITTVGPGGQNVTWQSLPPFTVGPCVSTTITVSNTPQATPTPVPTPAPTATPSPTPTLAPSQTPAPTPTAVPGTPTPTPVAQCTVPTLTGFKVTVAQARWVQAGFTAANFSAVRPPSSDYTVASQSIASGSLRPCLTTTIQVDN